MSSSKSCQLLNIFSASFTRSSCSGSSKYLFNARESRPFVDNIFQCSCIQIFCSSLVFSILFSIRFIVFFVIFLHIKISLNAQALYLVPIVVMAFTFTKFIISLFWRKPATTEITSNFFWYKFSKAFFAPTGFSRFSMFVIIIV